MEVGEWLTTAEAADLAKIEPDTLRHYARSGHAPQPQRFGRSLMWNNAEIRAWLRARPGQGTRTDRASVDPTRLS